MYMTKEGTLRSNIRRIKEERKGSRDTVEYSKLNRVERHIFKMARKNNLDYHDLLYATWTIEAKHKGLELEEIYHSKNVVNHSQELWDIAYHSALYAKAAKHDFWKFY